MANSYLQFSARLDIAKASEKTWLERYLPLFDCDHDPSFPELLESLARDAELCGAYEGYKTVKELVGDEYCQAWSIERGDPEYVWFFAEEGGSPEMVLALVHIFMAHFKKEGLFELSWACYCDKLRFDEFGGGAGFANSDGFDLWDAAKWTQTAVSDLKHKE
jgi:hypothetical protein